MTGGFTLMGQTQAVGLFDTNSYQANDDLTLVKGNHQLAVGASVAYWKMDFVTHARSGGGYTFNGQIFGLGMADFLMGRVQQLEHGGPVYLPMDMWYLGTYVQDTWRASSRVTINAGVRWEPYFGQRVLRDHAPINFSLDNFRNDVRSTIFRNAPAGPLFHGDPGFEAGKTGLNTQWWNLSPRAGVAWDVTGDGRMSLRSSYALGYDFQSGEYHQPTVQNSPFGQGTLLEDPAGGMDDPYRSLGGDPHPLTTNADTPFLPLPVVRGHRSRHQFAARPVVERHRRAPAWHRLCRVGELSRQLFGSPVVDAAAEPGRLPGNGALHSAGGRVSGVYHNR